MSNSLIFSNDGFTNYLVILTTVVFLIAGMVKGSIGMGLPLVSLTLLSFYTSPRLAMMLIIVPTLVTNFLQFYRSVDRFNMVLSNKFLLVSLFVCTFTFTRAENTFFSTRLNHFYICYLPMVRFFSIFRARI